MSDEIMKLQSKTPDVVKGAVVVNLASDLLTKIWSEGTPFLEKLFSDPKLRPILFKRDEDHWTVAHQLAKSCNDENLCAKLAGDKEICALKDQWGASVQIMLIAHAPDAVVARILENQNSGSQASAEGLGQFVRA